MTEAAKQRIPAITLVAVLTVGAAVAFYFTTAIDASADSEPADQVTQEGKGDEEQEEKAPIPVTAAAVATGRISSYLSATANLVPESEVEVLAEWEGRLQGLKVEEGDVIRAGQVLAELARGDAEIAVAKAKVRADTARHALERAEKLRDQELLSPEDFDQTALDSRLADQELAEARWRLDKTFIRSPFGGRVTQRIVRPGQHIRPGDHLFTVADFDPLIARIYLPEQDVLALDKGRKVRIALRADSSIEFDGRIQQISPVVDTATGTVKVTIEARQVPQAVRPGAFVRVDIVKETRDDAVLMPREAVVRELQSSYVYVARDGVAEKRTVDLGLEEGGMVEAVSGLAPGDRVIVAGQGGLKDGAGIRLLEAS